MSIKVARRQYRGRQVIEPPTPANYVKIVVMINDNIRNNEYGGLSPYNLRDENNIIMENKWQFSKVYRTVPAVSIPFSTNDKRIVWQHPAEKHIDANGQLTSAYYAWRNKGFTQTNPIRFPVGMSLQARASCVCSYKPLPDLSIDVTRPLNYIEARKQIYCPEYVNMASQHEQFQMLRNMLNNGINLMIVEVDGPHDESLDYYRQRYGVDNNFIVNSAVDVTIDNMRILINDDKHAFGHGYCLAMALLDIVDEVIS